MPDTSACIGHPLILPYIEALYQQDIKRMAADVPVDMYVPLCLSIHVDAIWSTHIS